MPKPIFALCMTLCVYLASYGFHSFNYTISEENNSLEKEEIVAPLALLCPAPVTISVPANACTVMVNIPLPTSDDPMCPIVSLSNNRTGTNNPSGMYSPETFVLVWTISDACGNTRTCDQLISITDNTAPILECPQNILVPCGISDAPAYGDIDAFLAAGGQSTDNCVLDSLSFELVSQNIVMIFPVVRYSRVYRIFDIHTNQATCMQSITISDLEPPTIICPPDITTGNSDDGRNTMVIVDMPITDDNCAVATVINDYNDTNDASDFYPVGTTFITWTATDTAGNTATCQMSVFVFDNSPPEITCPDEEQYGCLDDVPLPYADLDEFLAAGGDVSEETQLDSMSFNLLEENSDGMSCPETITRIYVVSDTAGNSATCTQQFIVDDQTVPVIQTPANLPDINCNTPLPTPQILTATDNCGNVNATGTVLPFTPNICNGYTVTHRWTATDACGNMAIPVTRSFLVRPDTQGPVITPPANITVNTNNNLCTANVTVPALVVTDNCSTFSITNNFTNTANASGIYPIGTTVVLWTVTDLCGNTATVNQSVTVVDNQGPNLICKTNLVIALNDFINDLVPAGHFVESAVDNCGGSVQLAARRMNVVCGVPGSNTFGPTVPFCCADVPLNDIMVEIRATDARGLVTTCMVNVDVQDNMLPIIHDELPDISISCAFPLNLNNLSVFGTFVAEGQPRANIQIPDHFYLPSGFAGRDGVYFENCSATVTSTVNNNLNMCNTGTIERVFTITDGQGLTATSTQTITVIDVNPFNQADITWPQQNVYLNDCTITNPNPNITGRPVLNNDKCSQAAATSTDMTFPNNAYCRVIRRTWTVVDWCTYVPNTNQGRWTFDQYIYITNTVPPTINPDVCQAATVCTPNGGCSGVLSFTANGTDDCTPVQLTWSYKIDEGNNNTIDFSGNGNTINRPVGRGVHKIIWEARDGCGNKSSCEKLVTVRECKAPTGIVFHGLAVNLPAPMGMATITAANFNNGSSDNCTPAGQLRFSFSANVSNTTRVFDCSHLGQQPLQIWVTDLEGNQTIVNTFIVVQDNHNVCNSLGRISLAGVVTTVDKKELVDTKVILEGGETSADRMTDEQGKYCFENLGMFNDYRIVSERTSEPMRGVSTLDLVLIQRHILGMEKLSTPEKYIAADIDRSGKINSVDLVTLRKLILGSVDTFPNNKPWEFVKEGQQFLDMENPWLENLAFSVENLDSSRMNTNFIGIKIGDVNHSYSSDLVSGLVSSRSVTAPQMIMEDILMKGGELTSVPVTAKNLKNVFGYQFTIELQNGVVYNGFEAVNMPLMPEQITKVVKDGRTYITCAFHDIEGISIADGEIIFNLLLTPGQDVRLSRAMSMSHDITPSKVYSGEGSMNVLTLQFKAPARPEMAEIKQNNPNPFKEETTIQYQLVEKGLVSLTVFDGAGKMVFRTQTEGNAGLNSITLGQKELGESAGILFVKIKSGTFNEVVKMLRIE